MNKNITLPQANLPHEDLATTLAAHDDYRVVRRLVVPQQYADPKSADSAQLKYGLVVDTETTGFSVATEEVIEVGMVLFRFDRTGQVYDIVDQFSGLSEPSKPLSEEIKTLTGLDDEQLAGQRLDLQELERVLNKADIVIAHNSGFDRPFLETVHPLFKDKAWGCSASEVPWRTWGYESMKLEYLAYRHGFFYGGHRATVDCYATLHLLAQSEPEGSPLGALLQSARQTTFRVWAQRAPFSSKDILKSRGYRWHNGDDGHEKAWYIDTPDQDQEITFLNESVYAGKGEARVDSITAFNRFSERI